MIETAEDDLWVDLVAFDNYLYDLGAFKENRQLKRKVEHNPYNTDDSASSSENDIELKVCKKCNLLSLDQFYT